MKTPEIKTDRVNIFKPSGWLDSSTSLSLQEQFDDAIARGVSSMVVDCCGIDYISSAGLRTISNTAKKLAPVNGKMVLCALEDYVEEVFEISGLNSLMVITENLDDAIHFLEGVGGA